MNATIAGLIGAIVGAVISEITDIWIWPGILAGSLGAIALHWVKNAPESTKIGNAIGRLWPIPTTPRHLVADRNELDSFEIEYIHHIRTRSYETEIIITIGFFAALFSIEHAEIDDSLWTFSTTLPPGIILTLSKASFFALWVVRLGMSIHLILRSIWIALVGLGSTYPRGVSNSRLRSSIDQRIYRHLTSPDTGSRLTLKIDRMCNLVYAIWLSCLFSLLTWTLFIVFSYGLAYTIVNKAQSALPDIVVVNSAPTSILVLAALIALTIFTLWTRFKTNQGTRISVMRYPIVDIVQFFRGVFLTHGQWLRLLVVTFPLLCLSAGSLSIDNLAGYAYANRLQEDEIISSPAINKSVTELNHIEVYLPLKYLAKLDLAELLLKAPHEKRPALKKVTPNESFDAIVEQHLSLSIDTEKIRNVRWMVIEMAGLPVLFTVVPITNVEDGPHELNIEQKRYGVRSHKLAIPFYRITQ